MQEAQAIESAAATPGASESQPLSKNAQKRLAKAARIEEQKKERRAYEKEKKKEKKRQLAAKRAAGELDEDEEGPRKKAKTEKKMPFNARIVVDLGFDDLMTENEVKSLTSQLAFTYSANRKATNPFSSILFTSLNKRTFTRLEAIGNAAYKRWHDTEWWHESYERLWEAEGLDVQTDRGSTATHEGATSLDVGPTSSSKSKHTTPRDTVVYLTADSEEELTELKEGETYILGGICDHNRYKNLCLNKSKESQIRAARLPIGTYLAELKTRKVLTVNQTFEILLKWVETRDWKAALEEVVPKRKFNEKGRGGKGSGDNAEADEEQIAEQVIVNVEAMEDERLDSNGEGGIDVQVETSGEDLGTLVVAQPDSLNATQNGSSIAIDDIHPEVPPH